MATIPLYNKGRKVAHTHVDDADADQAEWLWHIDHHGYAARTIDGVYQRLHRVLLGLTPGDGLECDHLNGDRLDNRRANLRIVTHRQNLQNVHTKRDLPRGVYRAAHGGRFYAQVKKDGVKYCLGHHVTPEEASAVAEAKRRELGFHG